MRFDKLPRQLEIDSRNERRRLVKAQHVAFVKPIVLCPTAEGCNSPAKAKKHCDCLGYYYEGQDSNEDEFKLLG